MVGSDPEPETDAQYAFKLGMVAITVAWMVGLLIAFGIIFVKAVS